MRKHLTKTKSPLFGRWDVTVDDSLIEGVFENEEL